MILMPDPLTNAFFALLAAILVAAWALCLDDER